MGLAPINPATGVPMTARKKTAVPRRLRGEIATTRDGRDITQPYIAELQQARDPLIAHSIDWGLYDQIFRDDQVKSCFQQRVGALVSREWDVIPGGEEPRDIEAAEALKANIDRVGIDRVTEKTMKATFNGYSVTEIMWEYRDGLVQFQRLHVRHARRFRVDRDNRLRLLTNTDMTRGERLPDRKFWLLASGGDDDDEVYGRGLAYWLYWPTLFKRNGLKFWNVFLDKFGAPTAMGKFPVGTSEEDIQKLLAALQAFSVDSGFAIPEGMDVALVEAARSGTADFNGLVAYMDGAIAKVILSQVGTTENGKYAGTADTHADVKLEVVKADADMWSDSFNAGPVTWWTEFNFPGAAAPRFVRAVQEEEDLKKIADTDAVIRKSLGWERTDESFQDTYGDGYVRTKAADPALPSPTGEGDPRNGGGGGSNPDTENGQDAEEDDTAETAGFAEQQANDDSLDAVLDELLASEPANDALRALANPLLDALADAATPEEARAALDRLSASMPTEQLTETLARAGFATRLAEIEAET
ncbi:MAG: DUF935 family protein [Pseudomonadota bacterium]